MLCALLMGCVVQHGFLKIIFCPHTRKLLGVHAIGENATEIIHIGQVVLTMGGTIDYFRDHVFNFPSFAEVRPLSSAAACRISPMLPGISSRCTGWHQPTVDPV